YGYNGLPMRPVAPQSPDYIPGLEEPQTPPVPQDKDEREPMFIQPHDHDYVPEPMYPEYIPLEDVHDPKEYEDDETEDGPVDYPMDGRDDGDDDDGDSSGDDADDKDEDEEDEEEEEHLAPADFVIIIPTVELVSPPEGTEPVIPPPSTDTTTTGAKITVWLQAAISLLPEAGERLARDDILETEILSTLGSRYEIEESSTAKPTGGRGIDYGFISTLDAEARRRGIGEVGYGTRDTWVDPAEAVPEITPMTVEEVNTKVTELAELHEHDTQDLYALLEDAHDSRARISQRVTMDTQQADLLIEDMTAHQETIQIMAPVTRQGMNIPPNNTNPNNMTPENVQTVRPCFYTDFMKCQPLDFKGTEGVVDLTRWIEKMESVFQISGCAIENQVKFATCTLLDVALTWWNSKIRSLSPDAYLMTWEVKGNDVPAYTERFQELTLICTKFVANETEKIDKYIGRFPDNIYKSVKASKPKMLDKTIELANDLMDQKLRTYAERRTNNKRKADDLSRNNHGHQQQPAKK
nr:hypothetical protein [Tanacetum cinerariifolium]